MKKEALFCDGTEAYVSPPEPEMKSIWKTANYAFQ